MDQDELKIESSLDLICHGCLSNDRQVRGLGLYSDMFLNLVTSPEQTTIYSVEDIKLCWECIAVLKKFKSFKSQLKYAQRVLMQMIHGLDHHSVTLSKLSIVKMCYYNQDYQYLGSTLTTSEECDDTDQKIFIDMEIIDYKDKADSVNLVDKSLKEEKIDKEVSEIKDDVSHENKDSPDSKNYITVTAKDKENENNIKDKSESETKNVRAKKRKLVKSRDNSVGYYKQYTRVIERETIDWEKIEIDDYFTMTTFGEAEMEDHFLSKERKFSEVTKFEYKCMPCELGYMKSFDLKRHNDLNHQNVSMTTLSTEGPYKCSHCLKHQVSQEALETHWRGHTPIAKCKECGDVCRPRGMKNHLNYAHTKKYACQFCNLIFGKILHFSVHYKETHQNYICDYCNASCKSKILVQKHIRTNHTKFTCKECDRLYPSYRQFKRHNDEKHPKFINNPELAYCVECNKQYASVGKYKKHLQVSRKHKGAGKKKKTRLRKDIPKNRSPATKEKNGTKTFRNDISTSRNPRNLMKLNAPRNVPTPCPDCGKMFSREHCMRTHYNLKHLNKTKFHCELCDKHFFNGVGLKYHTDYVHNKLPKVKDKICDLCGKAFSCNKTMLNHRRTHTGERPHKCPYCTAEFIQKYAMQTHMRTQHKEEQIKIKTDKDLKEVSNLE